MHFITLPFLVRKIFTFCTNDVLRYYLNVHFQGQMVKLNMFNLSNISLQFSHRSGGCNLWFTNTITCAVRYKSIFILHHSNNVYISDLFFYMFISQQPEGQRNFHVTAILLLDIQKNISLTEVPYFFQDILYIICRR